MIYIRYSDNATNKNTDKDGNSTQETGGSKRSGASNAHTNQNKRSKVRYLRSFCHQVIKSLRLHIIAILISYSFSVLHSLEKS